MLVSSAPSTPIPAPTLAPSLTPASQPTISLLTDNSADTLSVESLTLLPPADSPHLHPCAGHVPQTHSLQRPDASIAEEEEEEAEEDGEGKGEQRVEEELQEEEGSPMDETETDATVKEETTTTELVTPTDDAPEGPEGGDEREGDNTSLEVDRDSVENTGDAERHTETPDSPELD